MRVGILGAGMAGLACATQLITQGHEVTLFDKGRGAGGRMSSRRVETRSGTMAFDHGAQYFTTRHPDFVAEVMRWHAKGLVAPWPSAAPDAWVGVSGMNAPVASMARQLDVRFSSHVMGVLRQASQWWIAMDNGASHGPYDTLVIAVPAEQAAVFLGLYDFSMATIAVKARSQPCWSAMIAFDGALPIAQDIIRSSDALHWAARDSAKPGRAPGETWVVQASADWSTQHLEEAATDVATQLVEALISSVPKGHAMPAILYQAAHRWRYAKVPVSAQTCLWNPDLQLGACGDWLLGPRVEQAWLSGKALAQRIA